MTPEQYFFRWVVVLSLFFVVGGSLFLVALYFVIRLALRGH